MTENELIKEKLSSLNSNTDLLICQTKNIVEDANNACCDFSSDKIKMCYTNNYITVQFGKETKYDGFGSDYRDGVIYIKYNDTLYLKNESFTIKQNGIIEIHFGYPVTSLVAFFGYESNSKSGDKNVENIVSIDLSNFNSSLIDDISAMFQGCTSLKEINFTNFDTSSVTNMNNLFKGCSSLTFLDLSGFRTSNVTDMSYMFYGCKSLKYLDISNFYIHYSTNLQIIFNNLNSLEIINLFNVQNGELLDKEIEELKDNISVCQKEDIISEDKATNICNNYIKACFGENVSYEKWLTNIIFN